MLQNIHSLKSGILFVIPTDLQIRIIFFFRNSGLDYSTSLMLRKLICINNNLMIYAFSNHIDNKLV